mgnify:CR=1 FL=1
MHPLLLEQEHVDLFGDIHGCYYPLLRLLERLGYRRIMLDPTEQGEARFTYAHPDARLAIFVGDLIDRGPHIREVVQLVQSMVESGHALMVLGNHEYNAIAFAEEVETHLGLMASGDAPDIDTEVESSPLPKRLQRLMKATLEQYKGHELEWRQRCDWFRSLPLFLEGETFRVVHACWDSELIDQLRRDYPHYRLDAQFYQTSRIKGSFEAQVADRLTRGTSMPLPAGVELKGRDGFIRRFFRTKFWSAEPQTYGDVVFQPDPLPFDLVDHPIKADEQQQLVHYPCDDLPVFFGHYWLKGRPQPLLDNVVCLDYSAVNFGRLTAYTYSGEKPLKEENFVWVYVDPS